MMLYNKNRGKLPREGGELIIRLGYNRWEEREEVNLLKNTQLPMDNDNEWWSGEITLPEVSIKFKSLISCKDM